MTSYHNDQVEATRPGLADHLADAEVADLFASGVQHCILRRIRVMDSAVALSAAVKVSRDFAVACLAEQAQYLDHQAASAERSAASRGPKAQSHATQDRQSTASRLPSTGPRSSGWEAAREDFSSDVRGL